MPDLPAYKGYNHLVRRAARYVARLWLAAFIGYTMLMVSPLGEARSVRIILQTRVASTHFDLQTVIEWATVLPVCAFAAWTLVDNRRRAHTQRHGMAVPTVCARCGCEKIGAFCSKCGARVVPAPTDQGREL